MDGPSTPAQPALLPRAMSVGANEDAPIVTEADNPLPNATLGDVRRPWRVTGPDRFSAQVLSAPLEPDDLVGIDASSVRVFRVDPEHREFAPIWRSGVALGLDRLWAEIEEPGLYLAIGLPRDRLLREAVRGLARQRREPGRLGPPTAESVRRRLEAAIRSGDAREVVTRTELTTTTNAILPRTARRGRAGGLLPFPWPHDASDEQIAERVAALAAPAAGLPEEALSFPPETALARPPAAWPGALDWPMYHHDPQHSGVVLGSRITSSTVRGLRLRWAQQLYGPVVSVPVLVAGKAFVGNGNSRLAPQGSGGTLLRVDLASGVVENGFTFATPPGAGSRQGFTGIACTPAVAYGCVYVSCQDGRIRCIDARSMALVWSTDLRHADPAQNQPVTHRVNAEGWSSPLVVDGRVYVGFGESESNTPGFVYCLDAATGRVIWLFCTILLPGAAANEPNVIPRSVVGMWPLPPGYSVGADPSHLGGAPWSSCAYDPVSRRIYVGTGNVLPQHPLPAPPYSLGLLSLDAGTGGLPLFFQPAVSDCYRPDDTDVDVGSSPTVYLSGNRRLVTFGFKGGSLFVLDADTLQVLSRRQMLPRVGGNGGFPGDDGAPLQDVDPHPVLPHIGRYTENFYGVFGAPAAHYGLKRLFVGVGGFAFGENQPGIDTASTAFLRALDWNDLTDAWPMHVGGDGVARYVNGTPPLYTTPGEAGFSSPVVVNDVVLASTSRPGLYAFDAASGTPLWSALGLGPPLPNSYTLGPAVSGDVVALGSANLGLLGYSL